MTNRDTEKRLLLNILPQPDDTTCGPTCLHAIYQYFGDTISLDQVISEHVSLREGGTFVVFLACHALRRGYKATIYTYNLGVFDPSWFVPRQQDLRHKLKEQLRYKTEPRLGKATEGYLEFLQLGGTLKYEDLTGSLIRKFLRRGIPILTGLSSTYLYQAQREIGVNGEPDDLRGRPAGHFVVLSGYQKEERLVAIADPFLHNPMAEGQIYDVCIDRVICSILLGIVTHDANLLIIEPRTNPKDPNYVHHRSR